MKVAEIAAREAEHARRYSFLYHELAEARAEVAELHRHLERSESLRAELAGHLFEASGRADAGELVRLRQRLLAEDQRALVSDRTVARLRERVEELVASREVVLTRVAEWQQLIRRDGPEAADLSEFLAELRREILDLEHRAVSGDAREAVLRERLARAGLDPDEMPEELRRPQETGAPRAPAHDGAAAARPERAVEAANDVASREGSEAPEGEVARDDQVPDRSEGPEATAAPDVEAPEVVGASPAAAATDPVDGTPETEAAEALGAVADEGRPPTGDRSESLRAELRDAGGPTLQADLLLQLGRSGDARAVETIRPWTASPEPSVRAAAYESLGRLLERTPSSLEPHLRRGLADPDARVRRRVALAAATARGVAADALLDPLRDDPDPQVRRVIRQVLRQGPSTGREGRAGPDAARPPEDDAGSMVAADSEQRAPRPPRPLAVRPSRTAR
jgi:hypothetical protein